MASPQALLDPVNSMNPTYGLCVRLFTASDDFASLCLRLPALLVRLAVGFPSLPLGPAAVKRQEKGEMKQPGFGTPTHNLTTSGGKHGWVCGVCCSTGSYLVVPCRQRPEEMAALPAAILLGEEGRAGGGL